MQTRFNIDELLHIFSKANNKMSKTRLKPGSYITSLHDQNFMRQMQGYYKGEDMRGLPFSAFQNVLGLYPHNTFKIRPEFLGCPQQPAQSQD